MGNCQKQQDVVQNVISKNIGPVNQLKIYNYVWENAYQGLFDYQSNKIQEKIISAKDNAFLRKQKGQLHLVSGKQAPSAQKFMEKSLFQIIKKANYFKISPIYIQVQQYMLQKLLWLIVRTLPQQKYVISERDIIKFGKQKIKIKELVPATMNNHSAVIDFKEIKVSKQIYDDLKFKDVIEPQQMESLKKQLGSSNVFVSNQQINQVQSILTSNQINCRVCLQPGAKLDPLIAPCKCTGSIRYIHLKCLRTWLSKRLNVSKHKCCITLNWQKLCCEMCQQPYKYRIYLDNKKFYTVEIPKPQKPYVVFEVMKKSSDKTIGKIYHFVSLSEKDSVSIGRKKDVDVRISDDISVSRHHGTIMYDHSKHQFLLSDNKSKFGTLVLVKKNLCVRPNMRNIGFQIGTQVYRFESRRGLLDSNNILDTNLNKNIEDIDNYLNVQDSQDDEGVEQNEQNSDDSQQRFEEAHEQQPEPLGHNAQIEGDESPVLRRTETLVQGNAE